MLTLIGSPLPIRPCDGILLDDLINGYQSLDYCDFHYMPGTGGVSRPSQVTGKHPTTMSIVRLTQKATTDAVYGAMRAMRMRPISEVGLVIFGSQYEHLAYELHPVAIGGRPWPSSYNPAMHKLHPGECERGPGWISCRGFYSLTDCWDRACLLGLHLKLECDGWEPGTHFLVTDLKRDKR